MVIAVDQIEWLKYDITLIFTQLHANTLTFDG